MNHKFDDENNSRFVVVKHPVFGVIVGLVATQEIRRGEEVYVNYHYDPQHGPAWYREGYRLYLQRTGQIEQ